MRSVLILMSSTLLLACASTITPNARMTQLQNDMSFDAADAILRKYVAATDTRDGLCLIGLNPGARLNYDEEPSTQAGKIHFTGVFGDGHLFGKTLPIEGATAKSTSKEAQVDTNRLKEVRVIDKNVDRMKRWCPTIKPGFLVVLKPVQSLPSDAELMINVATTTEVEELVAALTYFSPSARLVGGTGM